MRVGGRVGKSELVADRKLLADRKLDFQGDRVREGFFDLFDDLAQLGLAALVRMPMRQNVGVEVFAVVTPAAPIEGDVRIRRIHDAVIANTIVLAGHLLLHILGSRGLSASHPFESTHWRASTDECAIAN